MITEKVIIKANEVAPNVDIFNIQNAQRDNMLLTDIIQKAFRPLPELTQQQKEKMRNNRVFFTSRKTLLNEFNHFEGNMNIFQRKYEYFSACN